MSITLENSETINATQDEFIITSSKDINNSSEVKKKNPFKKHFIKKNKQQKTISNSNQDFDFLFSMIRNKYNIKESDFLELLDNTIQKTEFKNIIKNEISLLSYAALYNNKDIFNLILNNYPSHINEYDFVNNTFKYSIYKDYSILNNYLNFLTNNFTISNEFITKFTLELSKTSYRIDNNKISLLWLENRIDDTIIKSFWDSAIEYKNIPIINLALSFNKFKTFLSNNLSDYENSLISIGRFNEIKQSLFSDKIKNIYIPSEINSESDNQIIEDTLKQNPIIIKKKKRIL